MVSIDAIDVNRPNEKWFIVPNLLSKQTIFFLDDHDQFFSINVSEAIENALIHCWIEKLAKKWIASLENNKQSTLREQNDQFIVNWYMGQKWNPLVDHKKQNQ